MAGGGSALIAAGAVCVAMIGAGATMVHGPRLVARLDRAALAALDRAGAGGVQVSFTDRFGWLTRNPQVRGDDASLARAATALADVPGVGAIDVPLWVEIEVSLLITYGAGLGIGRLLWGRTRQAERA